VPQKAASHKGLKQEPWFLLVTMMMGPMNQLVSFMYLDEYDMLQKQRGVVGVRGEPPTYDAASLAVHV